MPAPKNTGTGRKMTVSEFLDWAEGQDGNYELVCGEVFPMALGDAQYARAKAATANALSAAIERAGKPRQALIGGPGVAIAGESCNIPDISVYCGERAPGTLLLGPDPLIVVEVLSPSMERQDKVGKLAGPPSLSLRIRTSYKSAPACSLRSRQTPLLKLFAGGLLLRGQQLPLWHQQK